MQFLLTHFFKLQKAVSTISLAFTGSNGFFSWWALNCYSLAYQKCEHLKYIQRCAKLDYRGSFNKTISTNSPFQNWFTLLQKVVSTISLAFTGSNGFLSRWALNCYSMDDFNSVKATLVFVRSLVLWPFLTQHQLTFSDVMWCKIKNDPKITRTVVRATQFFLLVGAELLQHGLL